MKFFCLAIIIATAIAVSGHHQTHQLANRSVIVHLFEWKYNDIAEECEKFLGPHGFGGVQTSVPLENRILPGRPWHERYQPVSYKLKTRSGDEADFLDMSRRCNAVGVRIYPDIVINHMAAGNGKGWAGGVGTGGSKSNPDELLFPEVPFGPDDFNQPQCAIDPCDCKADNIRNCNLWKLTDLALSRQYNRDKAVEMMNHLVDLGAAGFRVDTAKYMWIEDLAAIFPRVKNLNTSFGFAPDSRPFIALDVIDEGNKAINRHEYKSVGIVTEYNFSEELGKAFRGKTELKNLKTLGESWGFLPSEHALTFVDNHHSQRSPDKVDIVLNFKQPRLYKMATAFHMAFPYGVPRIMSSYLFENFDQGPPADAKENIISRTISADGCGNGWVCEHRWHSIYNMVKFRNIVHGTPVENFWDNGSNQIAFARGNKGFIAINGESNADLKTTLQTKLPAGTYCDVITGDLVGSACTGRSAVVSADGQIEISLPAKSENGVFAIHIGSKIQE